ncbi:MAG: ABC transporter permease [Bryobacteraceae bacterium]|jgi:MacB-like periplasmic core domain
MYETTLGQPPAGSALLPPRLAARPCLHARRGSSLALGIGSAAALFSLVNTVVLKPLTYREPGRLISIREVVKPLAHIYPTMPVNYQHFRFWRENARSFESMAALTSGTAVLTSGGEPETIGVADVSASLFDTLGVQPHLGRTFLPEDEEPHAPATVVITDGLWRGRLGAARSLVGQKILFYGSPFIVAGILPPSFHFPKNGELGPLTRLTERTEAF